ncbi:hypothetical protein MTR67_003778 [Solanum verrucosum]|uniref:Uncharacterized protein n=1 Tax=Solanum verrucosum TaxID=315347 RepID=A0AAF0PSU2_SOLVR|nr:hypothetical protein MTR67_003778 [Solanum verrucosum]
MSSLFPLLLYSLLKDNASVQKGEIFNFQGLNIEKKLQGLPLPFTLMHSILCCLPAFNFLQVAFKTGDYKQQVIFIGGLTDGFLATDYLEPLAIALDKEKWSLVQFLVSSSYSGYGTSSLRQIPPKLEGEKHRALLARPEETDAEQNQGLL